MPRGTDVAHGPTSVPRVMSFMNSQGESLFIEQDVAPVYKTCRALLRCFFCLVSFLVSSYFSSLSLIFFLPSYDSPCPFLRWQIFLWGASLVTILAGASDMR